MRFVTSPLAIACVALGACGTTTPSGGDASLDAAGESSTSSDASTGTDATGDAGCGAACRLFSNYCSTAACTCVSLPSTEPDPGCDAGTVTCLVDPCQGKTAVCSGGACAVQ